MKECTQEQVKKKYNEIAAYYHAIRKKDQGWFYNEMLEMPTTLKLVGNVKSKKILDIGCGTGIYAKILTKKGAKVKGLDFSEEMLRIAKKENPKVEFKVGGMEKLSYKNNEFDMVLAALSVGYVDNWDRVFKEVRRVLKPGGFFVFSDGNPVIDSLKKVFYKKKEFRVVKDYFREGPRTSRWFVMKPSGKKYVSMTYYHKTYGTIVKIIVRNGFEIVDYEDSYPLKKSQKLFPKDYKLWSNMPYFCTWKVMKK